MSQDQISLFPTKAVSADTQRLNLLALARVRGIGEASLKAFLRNFKDLQTVWEASPEELRRISTEAGLRFTEDIIKDLITNRKKFEEAARQELGYLTRQNVQLVTDLDDAFPKQLRNIEDPPRWLFVQGDVRLLSASSLVAVVGTREASERGIKRARGLTQWLAKRGFGIVSGLAEGIDQAAHQTALDCGAPTIAVLGTGISVVFPASTSHLRKQIPAEGGAIVTEYLPQDTYSRQKFVRRNRIQAGLSYATVPVEAQEHSGTAHTYRFARAFGRLTFGIVNKDHPENGIINLLRKDGSPIFILEVQESMSELEALLKPALVGNPMPAGKSPFKTLVREFERVITSYPIAEDDFNALKAELTRKWEEVTRGGQSSSA